MTKQPEAKRDRTLHATPSRNYLVEACAIANGDTSISPEREHVLALSSYAAQLEQEARQVLNPLLRDLALGRQLPAGPCEHAEKQILMAIEPAEKTSWTRTSPWWSGLLVWDSRRS